MTEPQATTLAGSDPFNRKQVEAVCRAVCKVEGLDPDDDTFGDGCDPVWTRYADAVAAVLPAPTPAKGLPHPDLLAATVSCSELEITIQCNDHDVKDRLMDFLTDSQSQPPTPAQGSNARDLREEIAKIVYDAFPFTPTLGMAQKPEWVPSGNSFVQDDARRAASHIMARLRPEPGFVQRVKADFPEAVASLDAALRSPAVVEGLAQLGMQEVAELLGNAREPWLPARGGWLASGEPWRQVAGRHR